MIRYCKKCGSLLDDNATVCDFCGAKLELPKTEPTPTTTTEPHAEIPAETPAPKKKWTKKQWLIFGSIVLGVIAVIVAAYLLFFDPSIAVRRYSEVLNGKYNQLESLAPKEYWTTSAQNADAQSVEAYIDLKVESLRETMNHYHDNDNGTYGKLKSMSHEVIDTTKVPADELDGIKETLSEKYDIDSWRVGSAYNLFVKVTYHGSYWDYVTPGYITSIQIDGEWYLITYHPRTEEYYGTDEYYVAFNGSNLYLFR